MTLQEGFSLLKSCACRSFYFMLSNLQAFMTHPYTWFVTHGLRNTALNGSGELKRWWNIVKHVNC